jgi:hypothetical protein
LRSGGTSYAPRCRVSTGQGRITNVRIERESITLPLHKGCRINSESRAHAYGGSPPGRLCQTLCARGTARPDGKAQAAGR